MHNIKCPTKAGFYFLRYLNGLFSLAVVSINMPNKISINEIDILHYSSIDFFIAFNLVICIVLVQRQKI